MISQNSVNKVRCIYPWSTMCQETPGTHIRMCCWSTVPLGDIRTTSFEDIWNGPAYQEFREKMLGEDLSLCDKSCPYLVTGAYQKRPARISGVSAEFIKNQALMWDEIEQGKTCIEARPSYIKLFPTGRCNLKCIMCNARDQDFPWLGELFKSNCEQLQKWFPYINCLEFVGGEPLVSKDVRDLIADFPGSQYPDLKFSMISNGILLSPAIAESLVGKMIRLSVSIDSSNRQNYERIRAGGKWETLMNNLSYLSKMKRDFPFNILTVVMKSNISELVDIAAMADKFGSHVGFQPIKGDWRDENIDKKEDLIAAIEQLQKAKALYPACHTDTGISEFKNRLIEQDLAMRILRLRQRALEIERQLMGDKD